MSGHGVFEIEDPTMVVMGYSKERTHRELS